MEILRGFLVGLCSQDVHLAPFYLFRRVCQVLTKKFPRHGLRSPTAALASLFTWFCSSPDVLHLCGRERRRPVGGRGSVRNHGRLPSAVMLLCFRGMGRGRRSHDPGDSAAERTQCGHTTKHRVLRDLRLIPELEREASGGLIHSGSKC